MAVHRLTLLDALRHLHTNGPLYPNCGICANVSELTAYNSYDDEQLRQLIQQWPDRAQHKDLPVEGSIWAYDADDKKWESPRRKALLNWLIHTLETEQQQNG